LGPGSVALFDQVLRSIFEEVIIAPSQQAPPDGDTWSGMVLEPFVYVSVRGGRSLLGGGYPVYTVTYGLRFYDPDGKLLERWSVAGRSSDLPSAMRHAAARLLVELPNQQQIRGALAAAEGEGETSSAGRPGSGSSVPP
jgi:hypothetical protein